MGNEQTERTLVEGQDVLFQPSAFYLGARVCDARVTKVWGPGCVNLMVNYPAPDKAREETSVLVCFSGKIRPNSGYYCYPKE